MAASNGFFGLPAELMTALGTVLGFALTAPLTYAQQNTLGNWLELIGQVLDSNAAQGQLLQTQQQGDRLNALEAELAALRAQVAALSHGSSASSGVSAPGEAEKTTQVLSPTAAVDSKLAANTANRDVEPG